MTLQRTTNAACRKVLKTFYQNEFQVLGQQPWRSPHTFDTIEDAHAELSRFHFNERMTTRTLTFRVMFREPKVS